MEEFCFSKKKVDKQNNPPFPPGKVTINCIVCIHFMNLLHICQTSTVCRSQVLACNWLAHFHPSSANFEEPPLPTGTRSQG